MNATDLRDLFSRHITSDNQLILNAELLSEAGSLAGYLMPEAGSSAQITIDGAVVSPDTTLATVKGKATFLNVRDMKVTLTGDGDDQSTWLRLAANDIPDTWRLSSSISSLPQYWATSPGEFGLVLKDSLFGELKLLSASFVLATRADDDGSVQPGLNLSGNLVLDANFAEGLAGDVLRWVKGPAPLPLTGTIRLFASEPPVIDLRAPLDDSVTFDIGSLHLCKAFIWLRTVTPPETGVPESRMELAAKVLIGTPKPMEMTISTELLANGGEFVFRGFSEDASFSLANGLADIASLIGVSANTLSLPAGLDTLSTLYVREVSFSLSAADKAPEFISVSLALPIDPPWQTPIPKLSITEVQTGWTVFFAPDNGIEGYVAGTFQIGKTEPVDIALSAAFPDFLIVGRLVPDSPNPISVTDIITHFLDVPDLPEIDIAELYVSAQPSTGDFTINGALTDDWSFKLGKLPRFAIQDVSFMVNRTSAAGFSGAVGGRATLGSATFDATYSFPGNNLVIDGKIPSIHLGELIETLSDHLISLPNELDLTLLDSEIAITKAGQDYTFFLLTEVNNYGTLFFEIMRTAATGWGVAVGLDLTLVEKLSDLQGFGFLRQIDFRFERMILVLSSVDLPVGFTFPDMSAYKATAPVTSGKVTIPSGLGEPKQGINFYARFSFGDRTATNNTALLKLYDYFSLQKVDLDVAIQISSQNSSLSALLMAGVALSGDAYGIGGSSDPHNLSIAAYLAVQINQSDITLFLRGLLTLSVPNEKLTFSMELGVMIEGFYVSGNMSGSWSNPFGIGGLTLSDLALEIGADWEGIPTIGFAGTLTIPQFSGSLAVIVNSMEPKSSVLAGSVSNLSLRDVVDVLVGTVTNPDPAAQSVIDVLGKVKVKKIDSFTLPLSISDALDKRDLAAISQAFQISGKVMLPNNTIDTLVVVSKKGQAWFITDKRNGFKHYEVKKDGDQLIASLEAQFYFCSAPTRIGTLTITPGYQIYGGLEVFGFSETTEVTISQNTGIAVEERMSEINLFNGRLRVQRAPGDTLGDDKSDGGATRNGPYLSISTFTQSSKPDKFRSPHFYVSGAVSFLGLADLVIDIEASEDGLYVELDRELLGTQFDFNFHFDPSPLSLSGGGTAGLRIDPDIDLSKFGLGTYHVAALDFTANLAFGMTGQDLTASASGDFRLNIPEFGGQLGPYCINLLLDGTAATLTNLKGLIEKEIKGLDSLATDLGHALLGDAGKFADLVKQGIISIPGSLDHVLKKEFGVNLADVTSTTTCFAKERLSPHMKQAARSHPAAFAALPGAPFEAAADQGDPLTRLRQLRSDLQGSDMGSWILNIYDTLSEPLVHLYDHQPADPESPTFKQVLDVNHGDSVYQQLISLLQTTGGGNPVSISSDFVANGQNIIANILDLAEDYKKAGDEQNKEGTLIHQGITALLNIDLSFAKEGVTYDQIKVELAKMKPPADPFSGG